MRTSSRMQSTRRMRVWTSPDFRRRLSVAERSCTTTARLSERPAPDASFPGVNFNGQRFVPSATERRIASCCIGLPMKQIAGNVTLEDGVRWLGPGVTLFAPGKDGGRDGKFSRKANCAEFTKRRGRRSSGLRVKRGPPPGLPTVFCRLALVAAENIIRPVIAVPRIDAIDRIAIRQRCFGDDDPEHLAFSGPLLPQTCFP